MTIAVTAPTAAGIRVLPFDPLFLAAVICLILIGFVMISSASIEVAAVRNSNPFFYMIRHGVFILLGLEAAIVVLRIPVSFWQRSGPWSLLVGFLLLVLVVVV